MHPVLARRERLVTYLAAWLPIGALLAGMLALTGEGGWAEALLIATPLIVVYAFLCLAAWYPCRALPLTREGLFRALVTHLVSGAASSAAWVTLARFVAAAVERSERFSGISVRTQDHSGLLFAVGVLLYLLSVAVHYVFAAFEASLAAERRALRAEVASREAELQALKAQLDPHFLFNSLNSISSLAVRDPDATREMCIELGDFLRAALRLRDRRLHPLAAELAVVRRYLAVEQLRFGDRLRVSEDIDPRSLDCLVPPMVLQPLVENALKHGIAQLLDGGTVRITSHVGGDSALVAVENPVEADRADAPRTRMGLDNVRRRLRAEFGSAASLRVTTRDGLFRATIGVPVARTEGRRDRGDTR